MGGRMAAPEERSPRVLIAIALFKLLKGILLVAAGAGALSLLHKDIADTITHWITVLRVDPDNEFIHALAARLFRLTSKQLKEIGAGTFVYAAMFLTEGIGLLMRKRWAEYMTVITTAGLIPLEIYEMTKHFTMVKVGVLVVNVAIVIYLIWRIRATRAPGAARDRHTRGAVPSRRRPGVPAD